MQQEEFDFAGAPQRARLLLAASPAEAWEGALHEWFRQNAPLAWQRARPAVVLVPHRSSAHWLKARLLAAGLSYLGIRFVTPVGLRESFARDTAQAAPLREHLRLLLAIAAEEALAQDKNGDEKAARAVARAPDHLLRAIDKLEVAGWDLDTLEPAALRRIARRFREHLSTCGFQSLAQLDRALLAAAPSHPPIFEDLLVYGFDAAHWPLWFLLRAAVGSAVQATVILAAPREEAQEIDALWIGSWEELLGEGRPVGGTADEEKAADKIFLIGLDATEQAAAVAQLSLRFLAEKSCARLGILFPRAGALSRLVAHELQRLGIPHNDSIGHALPGDFEKPDWKTWLQLQRSPRLHALIGFLRVLPEESALFGSGSASALERRLRKAYAEVLIDDLDLLRRFCQENSGPVLEALDFFPARASLAQFLEATERALAKLGWAERWNEIARLSEDWPRNIPSELPRSLFLRWLDEIASSSRAHRQPPGDHPYARVQLLTIAQAESQEWSHLIFAGMNEGDWPPAPAGDFARAEEIESFNRRIRARNKRGARQGRQGEGHLAIRGAHTIYLGASERRQIALRQFANLLETTRGRIALVASLTNEAEPERLLNPSELFTRLYFEAHGHALAEHTLKRLRDQTVSWLAPAKDRRPEKKSAAQTRLAYDARREADGKAGEYDFAFKEGTKVPLHPLSVSQFEQLLETPALVWLKKFLGVAPEEDSRSAWITSTGQWVHQWLASIAPRAGPAFARMPDALEIDKRILAAAEAKRAATLQLCETAGKTVPDWWLSGWENARMLARHLGARLAAIANWPWTAAEWRIQADEPIGGLLVRGQVDLLLARGAHPPQSLATGELWIIDFKTGAKKSLAPSSRAKDAVKRKAALRKSLLNGDSLQLAIYGLAVRHFGARQVWLSLLSPILRADAPQLPAAELAEEADIFAELARMQQTGIFGMLGAIRSSRFVFTPDYPLATLAIDQFILGDKWDATHPALAKEEEEYSW